MEFGPLRLARRSPRIFFATVAGLMLTTGGAHAASIATANSGNTAWVLAASALVLFMTLPGLALFYGGLVRARNLLSVLMHCFTISCVVSILWMAFGYSLVFTHGDGLVGSLDQAFLVHIRGHLTRGGVPEGAFVLFQMTFAVITPALIIGAFPERIHFGFVALFAAAWLVFVYVPIAHWVWGGGWLAARGVMDFAGGIVVHTTAGIAALVAAILVGRREGFPHRLSPPHNSGITMAGAGMLWVGWFGFNGGSALAADASAAGAILATHFAAAAGGLTWMAIEWRRVGKPTSVGLVTGCVAGLATITPAAGFVGPAGSGVMGVIGAMLCFFVTGLVKQRFGIDDSLDVFAVHGIGGISGSLLVAVFAMPLLGGVGYASRMSAAKQLGIQSLAIAAAIAWTGVCTYALIKLLDAVIGVRVSAEAEREGLDLAAHGERAYDIT